MRTYEALMLLVPTLDAEQTEQTVRRFLDTVQKQGGVIRNLEPLGRRRLAYEIAGHREGFYALLTFDSEEQVPAELRRVLGLSENVLRYLVMRIDETMKPADATTKADDAAEAGSDAADAAADTAAGSEAQPATDGATASAPAPNEAASAGDQTETTTADAPATAG